MVACLLAGFVGVACDDAPLADAGAEDGFPPGRACEPSPPPGVDPRAGVTFSPDHLLCVRVSMDAADLERLRGDNAFGASSIEGFRAAAVEWLFASCDQDAVSQFTWFGADLDVDGVRLTKVGIRKKGFLGSLSAAKPSIKIETDYQIADQRLGDTEHITLNNLKNDPTRFASCLAYETFAAAGHPAPRCNLASVMLNGLPHGPYAHVEDLKKPFLKRVFGNSAGSLYEATAGDLTVNFLAGISPGHLHRWEAKTKETDPTGAPLVRVAQALRVPDERLLDALGTHVNLDRFYTFWALEALVGQADGYASRRNNFQVYFDPDDGDRAVFVPWGADEVFQDGADEALGLRVYALGELSRRLSRIPAAAAAFEAELQRLLDEVWDEAALLASVDRFATQVRNAQDDPAYERAVVATRRWIAGRRAVVTRWLEAGLPPGPPDELSCVELPTPR